MKNSIMNLMDWADITMRMTAYENFIRGIRRSVIFANSCNGNGFILSGYNHYPTRYFNDIVKMTLTTSFWCLLQNIEMI
jgi:hypothetical protein